MDDARVGWALRSLRRRRGWTQRELAARVGLSQAAVSLVERGHLDRLSLRVVRDLFRAVDAEFASTVRWRSGAIDRLLDERHARLVEQVVSHVRAVGWETAVEVTFSVYGERGSVDVLAFHRLTRTALVVEVKSEVMDVEETLRRLDVKVRLAPDLARRQFGTTPLWVGRVLVLPDSSTSRDRIERHQATFAAALPGRTLAARQWLLAPVGAFARGRVSPGYEPGWSRAEQRRGIARTPSVTAHSR